MAVQYKHQWALGLLAAASLSLPVQAKHASLPDTKIAHGLTNPPAIAQKTAEESHPAHGEAKAQADNAEKSQSTESPEEHAAQAAAQGVAPHALTVDGLQREYFVHVPHNLNSSKPSPLVLCFHGGGGNAMKNNKLSHFNATADEHGFIVVYPQGIDKHWNDGRQIKGEDHDDIAFVNALLEQLFKEHNIDKSRIYCIGISNGGFFSQFIALQMPERIAAVASIAASMSDQMFHMKKPAVAVPVMFILGDQDPIVKYEGGDIKIMGIKRGKSVPAEDAVQWWLDADGCSGKPVVTKLPDLSESDGTRVERAEYESCKDGSEVVLLTVQGGGHTWPSGMQYLPEPMIGRVSRDINNEIIWDFLQKHRR
jgi:polyhydroxybutyrate depolymerase